jgi:hypothetical protein
MGIRLVGIEPKRLSISMFSSFFRVWIEMVKNLDFLNTYTVVSESGNFREYSGYGKAIKRNQNQHENLMLFKRRIKVPEK